MAFLNDADAPWKNESLIPPGMHPENIATELTAENLRKCHDQTQSPLFSTIPPEIRNLIFALAIEPDVDPTEKEYKRTDFFYRPGHHSRQRQIFKTALLLSCRRAWLETNSRQMKKIVPTFWFEGHDRRPKWAAKVKLRHAVAPIKNHESDDDDHHEKCRMMEDLSHLTNHNRRSLQHIQIFAQMCWLESRKWRKPPLADGVQGYSKTVTITIRHTDWWYWESNNPLRMDIRWISQFLHASPFLPRREFRLELETLVSQIGQLRAIMDNIRRSCASVGEWQLEQDSGKETLAWSGPINIGKRNFAHYQGLKQLDYRVFTLVWHRPEANAGTFSTE